MTISDSANYDNRQPGETRKGNWMQTYTGIAFFPLDPRADEVHLEDIAVALSKACRYAGHCEGFYTVAEHLVHVSYVVPPEDALAGLLHDATEAYLVDVPRPIKRDLVNYIEIEDRLWAVIAERFGLDPVLPVSVKQADNSVLLAEQAQILKPPPMPWNIPGEPADVIIQCWRPELAYRRFIERYRELVA